MAPEPRSCFVQLVRVGIGYDGKLVEYNNQFWRRPLYGVRAQQENQMRKEKLVIVLRGLPGTGKSTYVQKHHPTALVCSADNYFLNDDGVYDFQISKISEAHEYCLQQFIRGILSEAATIVVDNTNTQRWEYEDYVLLADKHGYNVQILRIRAQRNDIPLLVQRNVHDVPKATIRKMFKRFEDDPRESILTYPFD